MSENPYKPPQVDVSDVTLPGDDGLILIEPEKLPAGRGWGWIKDSFLYFKKNPGMWIVIVIVLVVLNMVLAFIPFIGSLVSTIIGPIFTGGLMLGCYALDREEPLTINHLFAGFNKHGGNLAIVGLMYLVGFVIIGIIIVVLMLVIGGSVGVMELFTSASETGDISPEQMTMLASGGAIAVLVGIGLAVPLIMAIYFAPPLIVLHDVEPITAMKMSFKGCLRNILPFLVYGLVFIPLALLATLPLFLGWLVLAPILMIAIYVAYRDIFTTTDAETLA